MLFFQNGACRVSKHYYSNEAPPIDHRHKLRPQPTRRQPLDIKKRIWQTGVADMLLKIARREGEKAGLDCRTGEHTNHGLGLLVALKIVAEQPRFVLEAVRRYEASEEWQRVSANTGVSRD